MCASHNWWRDVFAGDQRSLFERAQPYLMMLGRFHTGMGHAIDRLSQYVIACGSDVGLAA